MCKDKLHALKAAFKINMQTLPRKLSPFLDLKEVLEGCDNTVEGEIGALSLLNVESEEDRSKCQTLFQALNARIIEIDDKKRTKKIQYTLTNLTGILEEISEQVQKRQAGLIAA